MSTAAPTAVLDSKPDGAHAVTWKFLSDNVLLDALDRLCTSSLSDERNIGSLRQVSRRWDYLIRTRIRATHFGHQWLMFRASSSGNHAGTRTRADAAAATSDNIWNEILRHFPNLIDLLRPSTAQNFRGCAWNFISIGYGRPQTFELEELRAAFTIWRNNGVGGMQQFVGLHLIEHDIDLETMLAFAEHPLDSFEGFWKADVGHWGEQTYPRFKLDPSPEQLARLIKAYAPTWTAVNLANWVTFDFSAEAFHDFFESFPNLKRIEAAITDDCVLGVGIYQASFAQVVAEKCPQLQILELFCMEYDCCADLPFDEDDLSVLADMQALERIHVNTLHDCYMDDLFNLARSPPEHSASCNNRKRPPPSDEDFETPFWLEVKCNRSDCNDERGTKDEETV
ncbi:hypothetical protein HDU87_000463 [Geranomyces variabilis]|uniref:F-box domain-containing protein n=1 Tax=Geranomyces variabilis TaxID=109894 RepID=A0AAD5TEN0_9FUNG|nr:hypothetical protein HDU87_000463 [Geranomyces variabilis]